MHGFAAEKFADARAQHGTPIAHARVRGAAAALELHFQPVGGLTQQDGAAIAQLSCPDAKLVAAVNTGQRSAAGRAGIAREHLQGLVGRHPLCVQVQQLRHTAAGANPVGLGQGRGIQAGEEGRAQARKTSAIARQVQRRGERAVGMRVHGGIVS